MANDVSRQGLKGAFSGATRRKPGWFEMAQRGTVFLDEVGEMAPKTQVDLLRVLEQQEVRRLGGSELIPLDVRLLAATHREIQELLAEGKLREDPGSNWSASATS